VAIEHNSIVPPSHLFWLQNRAPLSVSNIVNGSGRRKRKKGINIFKTIMAKHL
jgi:hypothetical protein